MALQTVVLNIETRKIFCKFLEFLGFTVKGKFTEGSSHQFLQ